MVTLVQLEKVITVRIASELCQIILLYNYIIIFELGDSFMFLLCDVYFFVTINLFGHISLKKFMLRDM